MIETIAARLCYFSVCDLTDIMDIIIRKCLSNMNSVVGNPFDQQDMLIALEIVAK